MPQSRSRYGPAPEVAVPADDALAVALDRAKATLSLPPFAIVYNATDTAALDVNLGNRLFERFAVTFDYQRRLLTISTSKPGP